LGSKNKPGAQNQTMAASNNGSASLSPGAPEQGIPFVVPAAAGFHQDESTVRYLGYEVSPSLSRLMSELLRQSGSGSVGSFGQLGARNGRFVLAPAEAVA
jgi:hypothetical protein